MAYKYNDLLRQLDWNLPESIQTEAIDKILHLEDFDSKLLIQPLDLHHWQNAAKILNAMGFNKVKHLTNELLYWVQDVNWPGAFIVLDLLKTFPNEYLLPYLENVIAEAIQTRDDPWLDYLSIFTYGGKISKEEFTNKAFFDILKSHENQWDIDDNN